MLASETIPVTSACPGNFIHPALDEVSPVATKNPKLSSCPEEKAKAPVPAEVEKSPDPVWKKLPDFKNSPLVENF